MKRRTLLLAAAALGCSRPPRVASSLALALWRLSAGTSESQARDVAWFWAELGRISHRVAERHEAGLSPAQATTRVLFDDLGFAREVESTRLDFVLLPDVLQRRRGSCVGLGTLYLCLAEILDFRAEGLLRPGHFYVRQAAPGVACNVELLRRGELMPDAWYDARFPLRQGSSRSYGRPLSPPEVVGVVAFNIGNERRRRTQLPAAARAYLQAIASFPSFAEAHASLGAVQQLLGDYGAASASYGRARELDPSLPGLDHNAALLGKMAR
jgi:regulator of sirC expression with transglutaminase-like and TPR domain